MSEDEKNEKILIYPDIERVEKICRDLNHYFNSIEVLMLDAISALSALLVNSCQNACISKGALLGHISNTWELNDEENEHPGKEDRNKINI